MEFLDLADKQVLAWESAVRNKARDLSVLMHA
jgi:hypothetical protein